jgi:hypothetical protein
MGCRFERHIYERRPARQQQTRFDSTDEGDQPVSRGKHRRGANDPVPDVQGAPAGGKHADRPVATSPVDPEDATHQEPLLREG